MGEFTSGNPVIRNMGICDPHLHVFDGKMYMYCSHDVDRRQTGYVMHDWCICSSEDLVDWRIESFPRPEDTYIGPRMPPSGTEGITSIFRTRTSAPAWR